MNLKLTHRPRRIRNNPLLRDLVKEQQLNHNDLVLPVFVTDQSDAPVKINSMPEVLRWPKTSIKTKILEWQDFGINTFAIFPQISEAKKNSQGSDFLNADSLAYQVANEIKSSNCNVTLIGDLALDPYTSHGHDGILTGENLVDNDATVNILSQGAVLAAEAGFDLVAPSDMMDGRISAIRKELDKNNFHNTGILAYSAKFSSAYYGPFRDAIGSEQKIPIDKSTYQLNPSNLREAKRELELDFEEGADILMVKPAEPYLDIISYAKNNFNVPVAAYQVSGEYSRIWAAHLQGWLDLESCALESMLSIKRAGADFILTYFAERIAKII
ncbi:MAG: porphobilinogen synthase [Opitutae bacterium]|jgi:porphobilinogen synthase|nr:porphobilinogen synthase [Opitutae bacterium]